MKDLKTLFKEWADDKFGPAPDPNIPQHERYASYFEAFKAGLDVGYEDSASLAGMEIWAMHAADRIKAAHNMLKGD